MKTLGIAVILAVSTGWAGAAIAADDSAREGVLRAVEAGPEGESFTLICDGVIHHRLIQAEDGYVVTVELPRVVNGVGTDTLPVSEGPVRTISIDGGGDDPTRVHFNLRRPVVPSTVVNGRGLELRLGPPDPESGERDGEDLPLGPEDLLEIDVFEIPELSRSVRISERGTISLPLLGDLEVEGLTQTEIEDLLHDRLAERYLQDPQVSVFVREHGSRKVSLLGAVTRPGVYQLLGTRNLLEVLSEAGGLTPAAGAYMYIIRERPDGTSERITVNIEALLVNRDPGINIRLQPGDVISVPVDQPVYIYVDGAVKSPGRLEEMESRPLSLLQAIAKAGGLTERANRKKIQILRQGYDGEQVILTVNLKRIRNGKDPDPVLRDGDVVVVAETFF